jgi:Cu/Ag efflux pump CusA
MMRWIVGSSLRLRFLVLPAAAALLLIGILQVRAMPANALPEFTPTTVEVQTEALGLSAREVEQFITVPLEQDLLVGVPFLDEIESASLPGLSSVVMTFEPGTDLLDARQVVQERLTQAVGVAGLPEVAKPPQMIQPVSSTRRVSMIKLSSDKLSPIDVSVLARWAISPRLMGVPGVANVTVWGFRDRQLQVLVEPERLRQSRTTLAQVIETSGNALEVSPLSFLQASSPGTGGFIDTVNQRLNIFHEQVITTPEELAQVPLEGAGEDGRPGGAAPRTLGDVTKVAENHQPLIGDAVCPGGEQCLFLVVEKFPGANTLEVTREVDAALDAMRPGLGDMRIDSSLYRPAAYIESSFAHLGWALLVGGLLLLLVIGALFWDWRRSLIVAAVIPVSLSAALAVLYLRGTTINLMIVAGLMLGLTAVIHEAVVDVHNLARRTRQDRGRDPTGPAGTPIVRAAVETRRAVLYAVLIIAAAATPLLFLRGEGDAFLPPIVLSYLLAVVASMVVALTVTPVLGLLLLANAPIRRSGPPWAGRLRRDYDRLAPRLVTRTGAAFGVAAAVALIGLVAVPFLDTSVRPSLKERDVFVQVEAAPGTSLPRMTQITQQAVQALGSLPGVVNVGGQVGRAVMSDQIVNVNSGEIWVKIGRAADYDRTLASIESTVRGYPDVSTNVRTYSDDRVADILGRARDDVVVRIYGENPDVLKTKAGEVRALIAGVDGVARTNVQQALDEPAVEVRVDLARAQAAGVKPGDVRRAAATLLGGITVGNLFEQQKVFDVVVWGAPEIRQSENDIEQLLVDTPNGGHVRVGDVAAVRVAPNPTVIRHESVATYLDVTADVAGRDVPAVAGEINGRLERVAFPLEHHAEVLGGFQERQGDRTRLIGVAVAAAITIFLLLQAAFRSWRLAILSFLTLPLALAGGVAAALLAGGTLTLGSIAGLIGVFGIATRGVVLLIRRYQDLQRNEGMAHGAELVVRGTRDMVAPTLISALATAAVLAPIVVVGPISGFEILQPMAVVVLGGLVTTTVLTLFVVPVLYLRYGFSSDRDIWTDELPVPVPERRPAEPEATTRVMRLYRPAVVVRRIIPALVLSCAALLLSSCGGATSDEYTVEHEPATVEPIAGADHVRVTLEARAAQRLAIRTTPVRETANGLVVPSSAVFVDPKGAWWVYTNPEPRVFVREEVRLQREEGDLKYLSRGPPAGTKVATVGVPELYGIEEGVSH